MSSQIKDFCDYIQSLEGPMYDHTADISAGEDQYYYELDSRKVDGLLADLQELKSAIIEANQDAEEGNTKSIYYALERMAELFGVES
jgi:hypothetical protein